jgi:hypothetical protein
MSQRPEAGSTAEDDEEQRLRAALRHLQAEAGVLERLVYKHRNQHRRAAYFQYLLKVSTASPHPPQGYLDDLHLGWRLARVLTRGECPCVCARRWGGTWSCCSVPASPTSSTPCAPSSHPASRQTRSSSRPSQYATAFALAYKFHLLLSEYLICSGSLFFPWCRQTKKKPGANHSHHERLLGVARLLSQVCFCVCGSLMILWSWLIFICSSVA